LGVLLPQFHPALKAPKHVLLGLMDLQRAA